MSAAITSPLVDVIDLFSGQRYSGCEKPEQLSDCHVAPWGLSLKSPTPHDPAHDGEITWVLQEFGLRMTQYLPRRRHARRTASVLTAVRVERDTRSWRVTNLLLGLEIPEQGCARVVRADEFAEAVSSGLIPISEADYALRMVHSAFAELGRHRDINQWLAHRGIFDLW